MLIFLLQMNELGFFFYLATIITHYYSTSLFHAIVNGVHLGLFRKLTLLYIILICPLDLILFVDRNFLAQMQSIVQLEIIVITQSSHHKSELGKLGTSS
ncbi:hypothetical protein ACJX0J_034459, partial [Zea mays]